MLYHVLPADEQGQAAAYLAMALLIVTVIVIAWSLIGATAVAQAGLDNIGRFAEALGF